MGVEERQGEVQGKARQGRAWHGEAGQGKVQGRARLGAAGQG